MLAKKSTRKKKKTRRSQQKIEKFTYINGIPIPASPGGCYHAIIASLSSNKDKFCFWKRIFELAERYIIQFGGDIAWKKFDTGDVHEKIKHNTSILTQTGKKTPGYRMHQMGMTIYYFQDGAIIFTGGVFERRGPKYNVKFKNGRGLQKRYKGLSIRHRDYNRYVIEKAMDNSGNIVNHKKFQEIKQQIKEEEELGIF